LVNLVGREFGSQLEIAVITTPSNVHSVFKRPISSV